ncbi:MAG TPA: CsbD family protein [Verrucomicrobiae bacterium]|nr:CsbD family protein [Verrucomicrobiae bacterium]
MNWDEVAGKWNQLKGGAKERWGKLTDDDLTVIAGKRDALIGKIQERYGITKEAAEEQVSAWRLPAVQPADKPRRKAS